MAKKINIKLLGEFSVSVDGKTILKDAQKLTKPWQLFVYLVLNDGYTVSGEDLLSLLWESEELTDPANVLKNTVYAIRRELAGKVKPKESPIVYRAGGYSINPLCKIVTDTSKFEELCKKAKNAPEATSIDLYRQATNAYVGDFLPQLDNENWTLPYNRIFKQLYLEAAHSLCALLEKNGTWNELLTISTRINLVEPLDEEGYLYTFRALRELKMYKVIVTTFNKTSRFFDEELNIPLCNEIRQIHASAAAKVNKLEQDILIIKDDLEAMSLSERPGKGAFFCSYEVFRRMYLLIERSAVRNKTGVTLVLLTVQDSHGHIPAAQPLQSIMSDLKKIISSSLRKSDTFCRFSRQQYAVLLVTENNESAQNAIDRVQNSFNETSQATRLTLNCKFCELHQNQEHED